jgi:hypothetical protein
LSWQEYGSRSRWDNPEHQGKRLKPTGNWSVAPSGLRRYEGTQPGAST